MKKYYPAPFFWGKNAAIYAISLVSSFLSLASCTDTGVLAAIEDAQKLSDGNLSNHIFAHSLIQIGSTVYLGSKVVWQKTDSGGGWSKIDLPSGLNTNETPVVSIATDGNDLFVASSKKVYIRSGGTWSSTVPSDASFSFYALRGVPGNVLAVDMANTIYIYKTGAWSELLRNTPMNDFTSSGGNYYLASGNKIKSGANLGSLTDLGVIPNEEDKITNLLAISTTAGNDYLTILAGGKLLTLDFSSTPPTWSIRSSEQSSSNIALGFVDDRLLLGRFHAGYGIYDFRDNSLKFSTATDDFTDTSSLVKLSSGDSITSLSLGLFLFYDHADDSKDRVYAVTRSSDGVFGAKRKGNRWFWGLE